MTIYVTLNSDQFIRISLWRLFSRRLFYFYAATAAFVTGYALVYQNYLILLAGWLPFFVYVLFGMVDVFRASRYSEQTAYRTTKYKFGKQGIQLTAEKDVTELPWSAIKRWRTIADCYVLVLIDGSALAIPKTNVPINAAKKFEQLLDESINP